MASNEAYRRFNMVATDEGLCAPLSQSEFRLVQQVVGGSPYVPPAPKVTREVSFTSSTWQSYFGTGAPVSSGYPYYSHVSQGQYGSTTKGTLRGLWIFPDMSSTLSGAEILECQLWIKNVHTYNNAGGRAHIFRHKYTSLPGTLPDSALSNSSNLIQEARWKPSFKKGEDKWLDMGAAWGTDFKNNAARGLGLHAANSADYGYWGSVAKIWFKYKK